MARRRNDPDPVSLNQHGDASSDADMAALDQQYPRFAAPNPNTPAFPAPTYSAPGQSYGDAQAAGFRESVTLRRTATAGMREGGPPVKKSRNLIRQAMRKAKAEREARRRKKFGQVTRGQKIWAWIMAWYQKIVIEGIFRQIPLPPSKDGRHVPLNPVDVGPKGLVDERGGKPYVDNFIRSSRYNIWDFIPKQLIFQFSKLGNFYFLVIGIMQLIPGLSTVGSYTTIAPLAAFITLSIAKEGYDDYRRYVLDKTENRSIATVLAHGIRQGRQNPSEKVLVKKAKKLAKDHERDTAEDIILQPENRLSANLEDADWMNIQWQHVEVGDILRLRRDEGLPADIVLLHATGPNSVAYVDTMALDGETNLKSKISCPLLAERCMTVDDLRTTQATIVSEDPNADLYTYDGRVTVDGETMPLSLQNVIYRGSTLRNTTEAIGLVINTGEECKIRMNSNKYVRAKKPAIESRINIMILIQITIVLSLAMGMTIGYYLWQDETENESFYLDEPGLYDASVPYEQIFFGFIILFNTLIPLSLYISLEIIKVGQLLMIQDPEMYDPVSDTPMVANTTTIFENLGQVKQIFSDKTGTLTENIMRFRKLSVAGVAFLHDWDVLRDEEAKRKKIEAVEGAKKGKQRGLPSSAGQDLQPYPSENAMKKPKPTRKTSTTSVSQWKSSGRPDPDAEMKTEELLEYVQAHPDTPFSRKAKHFILCIALCHTCLPEYKDDGTLDFQAASPDELALVEAARDFGYLLVDRPAQSVKLQIRDAGGGIHEETYQVLDVIEFSSKRKRMSIIIRMPDGRICIFSKGADNVIMARLRSNQLADKASRDVSKRASEIRSMEQDRAMQRRSLQGMGSPTSPRHSFVRNRDSYGPDLDKRMSVQQNYDHRIDENLANSEAEVFERCFRHIDGFASEGLRTLMYGYRYIDDETYNSWKQKYREAETSLIDRQERIDEASELIEQGYELAGATAIEDKLQDGVPETIDKLRRANIKVWMLTGDKRETAINIGHSARLCKPYSSIFVLDILEGDLHAQLTSTLNEVTKGMLPHSVIVVDGQTLKAIEEDGDLGMPFYDLAVRVDSVICCRASPAQKADLVRAMRRYRPGDMTLAVGDGANDIGMIQASQVGIGISGREGLQAARIADYSIAQFRFLQKLLLVHGRWNYQRTSKYILATFWKEMLFYLIQAHYQYFNGYTGTSLYEEWSLTTFNVLFTSLPVIVPGIFEMDLRAETLMAVPELYSFGQLGKGFGLRQYFGWMILGVAGSFIVYWFTYRQYDVAIFDIDTSLYAFGVVCFTTGVSFINIKLLILELHAKTIYTLVLFIISFGAWFIWLCAIGGTYERLLDIYIVRDAFFENFGRQLSWWATVLITLGSIIIIELVLQAVRRVYFPNDVDLMQRIELDRDARRILRVRAAAVERGEVETLELQDVVQMTEEKGLASRFSRLLNRRKESGGRTKSISTEGSPQMGDEEYQMDDLAAGRTLSETPRPWF